MPVRTNPDAAWFQCTSTGAILTTMAGMSTEFRDSGRNAWLPFEILGEVFHHVVYEDGPPALRHVMFVCKLWYTASIHHPQLWTRIFLDGPFFKYFKDTPILSTCAFLQQWLDRSGTSPLHLRLGCNYLYEFYPSRRSGLDLSVETADRRFVLLLDVMKKSDKVHIKRIESLVCRSAAEYLVEEDILSIFPPQLPLLRFMSISSLCYESAVSFSHCPLLTEVELSDYYERRPFFQSRDLARVKTLSFHNNGNWMSDDIVYIKGFASLEVLVLSNGTTGIHGYRGSRYSSTRNHADTPVKLPHLRILTVRGTVPKDIFLRLIAPALQELLIEDDDKGRTSVPDLYTLIPPSCHRIRTHLSPKVKGANSLWSKDLTSLVEMAPQINVLYVSKWMQQEMEGLFHNQSFELRVEMEQ